MTLIFTAEWVTREILKKSYFIRDIAPERPDDIRCQSLRQNSKLSAAS